IRDRNVTGVQTCALPIFALVWLAVRLLEAPTPVRHFAAGVGIGLAAFVRVDHGLYSTAAFALLILFRALRERKVSARDLGAAARSEERRVGKGGGCGWGA